MKHDEYLAPIYQAVPESYDDLKIVHRLLEQECHDKGGRAVIDEQQLADLKMKIASELPDREDIDKFFNKACKELIICKAFKASNVFTRYVFAGTVPLTQDLYQEAFANAPGLEEYIMANIASRVVEPVYGPQLTNKLASKIRRSKS